MIIAEFYQSDGLFKGFSFSGHAGYAKSGEDVVCASVSSAVQLSVNILDVMGKNPVVTVGDNLIECTVSNDDTTQKIIETLKAHFEAILEEFPDTIKITISEV